jgi:type II secretory ATPase GspE/PulE/Tfp pilus assembly ATPase PilB-like protein
VGVMGGSSAVGSILGAHNRVVEEEDAKRRAKRLGYPYLDLVSVRVPTELKALQLVREETAKEAQLAPVQVVGKKLVVAAFNPDDSRTKEALDRLRETHEVQVVVVSRTGLEHMWRHYVYVSEVDVVDISGRVEIDEKRLRELKGSLKTLKLFADALHGIASSKVTQALEVVLGGGVALKASDIHLEPKRKGGVLRMRLDGMLHDVGVPLDLKLYRSLISRVKLLSDLRLNVRDEAQDGRFTIDLEAYDIEVRTSVIPSEYGETVVLRILDPTAIQVRMVELGWRPDDLSIVTEVLERPHGLILNTGPTGSGKTTTLYAFLRAVSKPEIKVVTIEDPIEYHLEGVSQTQVDADAKYTFASGLRSILRQDPDVVLVGEVRDAETAGIALNAALTGHLVLSTLHTNDAVGAVPRLYDLDAKTQVLGAALSLVIAQRLVRVLCEACKKRCTLGKEAHDALGAFLERLPARVQKSNYSIGPVYEAKGCDGCAGVGFKGRIAVFELFLVDEKMERLIYTKPTEVALKEAAREQGIVYMQDDGVLKVLEGVTSFSEVERLTGKIPWFHQYIKKESQS